VPVEQVLQDSTPVFTELWYPALQGRQSFSSSFPADPANLPATHAMQVLVVSPAWVEYLPLAQFWHEVSAVPPDVVRYLPLAQSLQTLASVELWSSAIDDVAYLPGPHCMQSLVVVLPVVAWYFPAPQLMHVAWDPLP
jgi:hypothetical protein